MAGWIPFDVAGWILFGVTFLLLVILQRLYRIGVKERNNLTYYIAELLLSDEVRVAHKESLEKWLRNSTETKARVLSSRALLALQNMANRLAVGNPKQPLSSSVIGFQALIWNRKRELEQNRA